MTNKNHFLCSLVYAAMSPQFISFKEAAIVTTPDSVRCWVGPREFTHFTENPSTGEVSWIAFPDTPIKEWSKTLLDEAEKFSAGKPGTACVDEDTVLNEFWKHNSRTGQNILLFMHLVQDYMYDSFVREYIDTSRMYENIFLFDGKVYSGDDLRGKGMARWNSDGLLNQLDAQFYVRLAKRYYDLTGEQANREWIDAVMKPAIFEAYSEELAEKTVKFISMPDLANELITQANFDFEIWPLPNSYVDAHIDDMLLEIGNMVFDN